MAYKHIIIHMLSEDSLASTTHTHFYGTLFARKDQDTLIEQSGYGYSNRAVTVFSSKLLSYVCVVIFNWWRAAIVSRL